MSLSRIAVCCAVLVFLGAAILHAFTWLNAETARKAAVLKTDSVVKTPAPAAAPVRTERDRALAWLQSYYSADPVARDAALEQMKRAQATLWPALIAVAENNGELDEIRRRAHSALRDYSRPHLERLLLNALADRDSSRQELNDELQIHRRKFERVVRRQSETIRQIDELEARAEAGDAEASRRRDELLNEKTECQREEQKLRDIIDADRKRIRAELDVFESYVSQLERLREKPGYLPQAFLERWDPALLPEHKRLHVPVKFELVDFSLKDVCAHLKMLSGLEFSLDPRVLYAQKVHVTLRVDDMEVRLALLWIARLCSLDATYEKGRIVFVPEGQGGPIPEENELPHRTPVPGPADDAGDF